jgi:hypothetical protein
MLIILLAQAVRVVVAQGVRLLTLLVQRELQTLVVAGVVVEIVR